MSLYYDDKDKARNHNRGSRRDDDDEDESDSDDETMDPAVDALMQRGERLRQWRLLAEQDEQERRQQEQESDNNDIDECVMVGRRKMLVYESFLRRQQQPPPPPPQPGAQNNSNNNVHYDDLKHIDYPLIEFTTSPSPTTINGGRCRVIIEQDKSLGKGGLCWDAALILADHCVAVEQDGGWPTRPTSTTGSSSLQRCRRRTVVELGSGTGLAGILVAKTIANCHVYLTDLPALLPLMQRNVQRNFQADDIIISTQNAEDYSFVETTNNNNNSKDDDDNETMMMNLLTASEKAKSASVVTAHVLDWADVVAEAAAAATAAAQQQQQKQQQQQQDNNMESSQSTIPTTTIPTTFDIILGADVVASLYDPHALAHTLYTLSHHKTVICLAYKERLSSIHRQFETALDDYFEVWSIVEPASHNRRNWNPDVKILQVARPKGK